MPPEPTFAPRELLASSEAERAIIGAAVRDLQAVEDAIEHLTATAFADPVHARIWTRILHLARTGQGAAPYHVRDGLGADAGFDEWGGVDELMALAEVADPSGLRQDIATVTDLHTRRQLRTVARAAEARASDPTCSTGEEIAAELEKSVAGIAGGGAGGEAWINMGDAIGEALDRALARRGRIDFPFGIADLDKLTGGMAPGATTVVAGWTGMGKTMAGLNIARANALAGIGTCIFSLEMASDPMALRMACDLAYAGKYDGRGPQIDAALKGDLHLDDVERLRHAESVVKRLPVLMDVRAGLTVAQMKTAARRQHRRWLRQGVKPGPIIVDHGGKAKATGAYRGNATSEMGEVADDLDLMAKELHVPVIHLVQVNRAADQQTGEDKRPALSNLKQSSKIEANARQVVMLYRPEYYYREPMQHESSDEKENRLTKLHEVKGHFYWIVAKQSNGPPGQVLSFCDAACNAIRDWPG